MQWCKCSAVVTLLEFSTSFFITQRCTTDVFDLFRNILTACPPISQHCVQGCFKATVGPGQSMVLPTSPFPFSLFFV
jgi:hypothetical protein